MKGEEDSIICAIQHYPQTNTQICDIASVFYLVLKTKLPILPSYHRHGIKRRNTDKETS